MPKRIKSRSPSSARELAFAILQLRVPDKDKSGKKIFRSITNKEAAALIGKSERQWRRYKNGETTGISEKGERLIREVLPSIQLKRGAMKARERIKAHNRRELQKTGAKRKPEDFPVLPIGQRRTLQKYREGILTGETYFSDWINYDVRQMSSEQIYEFLLVLRNRQARITVIYEAYVRATDLQLTDYEIRRKRGVSFLRISSPMESFERAISVRGVVQHEWTDADIRSDIFERYCKRVSLAFAISDAGPYPKPFRPLYIGVLDKHKLKEH